MVVAAVTLPNSVDSRRCPWPRMKGPSTSCRSWQLGRYGCGPLHLTVSTKVMPRVESLGPSLRPSSPPSYGYVACRQPCRALPSMLAQASSMGGPPSAGPGGMRHSRQHATGWRMQESNTLEELPTSIPECCYGTSFASTSSGSWAKSMHGRTGFASAGLLQRRWPRCVPSSQVAFRFETNRLIEHTEICIIVSGPT